MSRAARIVVAAAVAGGVGAAALFWWPRAGREKKVSSAPTGPALAATATAAAGPWFEEVAAAAGIDFVHVPASTRRFRLPEIMSGGAAWFDYDGDGDLDLYLVQGGDPEADPGAATGSRLYRNDGHGAFQDVTAAAGVAGHGYGMGAACGDYDGDGDVDLYVTNLGPDILYRNNGDGTFTDVTAQAGLGHPGWGSSAAFLDYDADGDLDLFVVNYIHWAPARERECFAGGNQRDYCSPKIYNAPSMAALYRNDGDGTFTDVSEAAGLSKAFGNGLGVTVGDFDQDGRLDVYVANDGMPNQLWLNRGGGRFTDEALIAGCAVNRLGAAEAGMGVQAFDVENDGDLDLFITHLGGETNTFYRNQGGLFDDVTAETGLGAASLDFTGFGTAFADFDNDGELDVYVANGRVGLAGAKPLAQDPYAEPNQLFRGLGKGRFEEVWPRGGTAEGLVENSRAAAFGDYDEDGDVDVVVVNNGGRARLLRNVAGARGRSATFRVLDRRGLDAIGAMVRIEAGGRAQWRLVQTAYSYCASNDPRVHFGLGQASRMEEVVVVWPGGRRESFGAREAGRLHTLREGTGRPLAR